MKRLNILFLCTGNACRSQMAEGWAKALQAERVQAYSAGTSPHGMNPLAVQVMSEVGVDISSHHSKRFDDIGDVALDYVITVCGNANEACPVFPGDVKRIHAGFDDPPRLARDARTPDEALPHYRRVRDQIKTFIEQLDRVIPETGDV